MGARTHVWLLEQATPEAPDALEAWMRRRLDDPLVLGIPWGWLRALVVLVLLKVRLKRHAPVLQALAGPSPEASAVAALAQRMGRELGRRYQVQAVLRHGRPDAAAAAAEVKRGAQVVLVPLPLVGAASRRGLLAEARSALSAKGASLAEVTELDADPQVLRALSRGVRQAILRLPTETAYSVLFVAFTRGEDGAGPREDKLRQGLVRRLRLNREDHLLRLDPFGLGAAPLAGAEPALDALSGAPAVVVVPLGPLTHHGDVAGLLDGPLRAALSRRGVSTVVRAEPAAACSGLPYALAERVRAAERAMEWVVPEDTVQGDVEAELKRRGARMLPRAAPGQRRS